MSDDIVTRHHGFPNDDIVTTLRTMVQFTNAVAGDVCWRAADEIERLRNKLAEQEITHAVQKTNTMNEVERLRADIKELLEIAKAFADNGECRMYEEQWGYCTHSECDWHDAEHMWESFCMARGI